MNTIERDVFKHIIERLQQWSLDSLDLCDMAELSTDFATQALFSALMDKVTTVLATLDKDDFRRVTDTIHQQVLEKRSLMRAQK